MIGRITTTWTVLVLSLGLLSCTFLQPQRVSVADPTVHLSRRPANLSAAIQAMDRKKKTVCSMTMNSIEERETFKKYLPNFNFIELVTESSEWLAESCQSGVKCDVLVVSGHFAGSFWGSSGKLELAEAETQACNSSCPGVFQNPKEVYLFGCNTLGGKAADFRSPAEYRAVLIADHIPPAQADLIAAFRYSPLGDSFHDRMRAMFSGTRTSLYGFSSIAPSGANVEGLLQNYLRNVNDQYGDFGTYLEQMDPARPNQLLSQALRVTSLTQALPPKGITNPSCILSGRGRINEKLQWIDSTFRDRKQILAKLPQIDHYLETLEENFPQGLPEAEASYFERLQFNTLARDQALSFAETRMPGIWSAQGSVLNFAKRVGWLSPGAYHARVKNLIGDLFRKELSINDADAFCSSNLKVDLTLDILPSPPWERTTTDAIFCSRTHDPGVIRELVRRARSETAFLDSLVDFAPGNPDLTNLALDFLHHKEERVRKNSLKIVLHMDPNDPRLTASLRGAFDDEALTATAIDFLIRKRIFDSEFVDRVRGAVMSKNSVSMRAALLYFKEMKPQNEDIQIDVIHALVKNQKNLLTGLETLSAIKPRGPRVQTAMLDLLTLDEPADPLFSRASILSTILEVIDLNQPVSNEAMIALLSFLPRTDLNVWKIGSIGERGRLNGKKVQDFVVRQINGPDKKRRDLCLQALRGGPFQSAEITDALLKKLFDPTLNEEQMMILLALQKSGVTDLSALRKIASLIKDPDESIRRTAVGVFQGLHTSDPVIRASIVAALNDESYYVQGSAIQTMGSLGGWDERTLSIFMDKMEAADTFDVPIFITALSEMKPTSIKILMRAVKFLSHEDLDIRDRMESALETIRPQDREVLRAIRTHNPALAERLER